MTSLNKVIIIGRVGQDPEIKKFDFPGKVGGTTEYREIANLSVATSESYTKNNGEKVTNTYWHKVVINNPALVNVVRQFVTKGSQIYIEGSIKPREYQDKEGKKQTITEIVLSPYKGVLLLLDKKEKTETPAKTNDNQRYNSPIQKSLLQDNPNEFLLDDLDDEIPF